MNFQREFTNRLTVSFAADAQGNSDQCPASENGTARPRKSEPGDTRCAKLLPGVLGLVAGSADATSFLGLGLFSAHVTGNLVILAAHLVTGTGERACLGLSVPVFIVTLCVTRVLAAGLNAVSLDSLRPLLLVECLLLIGSFVIGSAYHLVGSPDGSGIVLAGQLSVAAMAVQNALVQLDLSQVPSTTVMTTNLTRFVMDVGEVLLGRDPAEILEASRRAKRAWPVIVCFVGGAALGAASFAVAGRKSLLLPAVLAFAALAMGQFVNPFSKKKM